MRTETLVAVTPSENANDNAAAAAAIEVFVGREVDGLVARELVRRARDAGVARRGVDRVASGCVGPALCQLLVQFEVELAGPADGYRGVAEMLST